MDYITLIEHYLPCCQQEESDKQVILDLIRHYDKNILTRGVQSAHITSSGFIFNTDLSKVLMVHHNIYKTWAWTGGHADGDCDLLHVALKEAEEETGVDSVRPLFDEPVSLDILPVFGHIKRDLYVSAHLHLSLAFALAADEDSPLRVKEDENSGVRWLSVDKLGQYVDEPYMLDVYKKIILKSKILLRI